jgi:hypothetical protein
MQLHRIGSEYITTPKGRRSDGAARVVPSVVVALAMTSLGFELADSAQI